MPLHLREMLPSASQISISTPIVKHHQNATKFMLAEALVRHNWPLIYNHIDLSLEKNTEQRIQHFLLHWEVQQLPMYNFSSHPTPPNSPTSVHMLVRDEIQVYVIHLDMEKPLPYFFACLLCDSSYIESRFQSQLRATPGQFQSHLLCVAQQTRMTIIL